MDSKYASSHSVYHIQLILSLHRAAAAADHQQLDEVYVMFFRSLMLNYNYLVVSRTEKFMKIRFWFKSVKVKVKSGYYRILSFSSDIL